MMDPTRANHLDSARVVPMHSRFGAGSLPVPLSSLVGRSQEISVVRDFLLDRSIRLVTLTGPGGVGKTRLALQAASSVESEFRDGAVFIELSGVRDPTLLVPTMARALGVRESENRRAMGRISDALRTRDLLLTLDNFEQILPGAPALSELLQSCPSLTIMVTSRTVLNLSGEWVLPVPALAVPGKQFHAAAFQLEGRTQKPLTPIELLEYEGIQLFVERSRASNPDFVLTDDNARAVEALCLRLDGLPLAIELAAARSAFFSPEEMLDKLNTQSPLLTGGPRDLPDRQRTMWDAIAWSYDLLDPTEQAVFRRLSVFTGECSIAAASVVCASSDLGISPSAMEVVDSLESLMRQSLIRISHPDAGDEPGSEGRVMMLEVMREFAAEKLIESGEADQVGERHAKYFKDISEQLESMLWGDKVGDPRKLIGADLANYLAALDWSMNHQNPDIALQLVVTFFDPGDFQDLYRLLGLDTFQQLDIVRKVLEIPGGSAVLRIGALCRASFLADQHGDDELGLRFAKDAVELAESLDDRFAYANAMFVRGRNAFRAAEFEDARKWLEEAMAEFQDDGDRSRYALTQCMLASLECQAGSLPDADSDVLFERAAQLCDSALATYGEIGFERGIERAKSGRAFVAYKQMDWQLGLSMSHELLSQARDEGRIVLHYVEDVADYASHMGQPELAARLYGTLAEERRRYGIIIPPVFQDEVEQEIEMIRDLLGKETFARETEAGRTLSIDSAIDEALEFAGTYQATLAQISLTPRELEIMPLLAKGRTAREIGEELFLSHRTVESHISNLYRKLDVQNREEAIQAAREVGLLAEVHDFRPWS